MSDETQNGAMPKWRKDFPIQWGVDNYITRREFTKFLVMISGATVLGNGYFVLQSFKERHESFPALDIGHVDDLRPGSVKLFRYPDQNDPAMLIRLANGEYVAYRQRCTHLSCPVHYAAAKNRLECPCHNGAFDAKDGTVLEGPPPRPLPRIALEVKDGRIFAKGVVGS
jgi:Rieske Fe-S protein